MGMSDYEDKKFGQSMVEGEGVDERGLSQEDWECLRDIMKDMNQK